jgi:alkaline phosphatase
MSKYADVYLLPILEENVAAYKKIANSAGTIFIKHGALKYREYVASDLDAQGVVPFTKLLRLKPGETVIYAAVEIKSEADRNKIMKRIFNDPEMQAPPGVEKLFNYKRMVYGGFKILVDLYKKDE